MGDLIGQLRKEDAGSQVIVFADDISVELYDGGYVVLVPMNAKVPLDLDLERCRSQRIGWHLDPEVSGAGTNLLLVKEMMDHGLPPSIPPSSKGRPAMLPTGVNHFVTRFACTGRQFIAVRIPA
ncbi:MAG: hypothetical protein U0075_14995 [Thermomicrobiales bacterium]